MKPKPLDRMLLTFYRNRAGQPKRRYELRFMRTGYALGYYWIRDNLKRTRRDAPTVRKFATHDAALIFMDRTSVRSYQKWQVEQALDRAA